MPSPMPPTARISWKPLQRIEQAQSPGERGDVLRDAIVAVEDRLCPQERLAQLARLGDAYDLIAGKRR